MPALFLSTQEKPLLPAKEDLLLLNNIELYKKLRILRSHGYNEEIKDFSEAGFNYRITDIQAALVTSQYIRLDEKIEKKES